MRETEWRSKIAEWMRSRWPRNCFIEESYLPYGTSKINERKAFPDILRVYPKSGRMSVIEVKKWENKEFQKWNVLGQLQLYTFLIETQHNQDGAGYHWMWSLIRKGLKSQTIIDHIERRIAKNKHLVIDWVVVIVGGEKEKIEKDELLWHMHDYVNQSGKRNALFRPLTLLHASEKDDQVLCCNLECWFRKKKTGE